MKKILLIATLVGLTYACSNNSSEKKETSSTDQASSDDSGSSPEGVGKFKHVDLAANPG